MTAISDPHLRQAEAPRRAAWPSSAERQGVAPRVVLPPTRRPVVHRMLAYGSIIAIVAASALSALATLFASPLSTPVAAPTWSIEMTSATTSPVTVLVYGREAGLHVIRVPAVNSADDARMVPARLAQGELHMMSLGLSSLRVRAKSPRGVMPMSWSAESRTVTAMQNKNGIGVRTSW